MPRKGKKENLKPFNQMSEEELKAIQAKGRKKAIEATKARWAEEKGEIRMRDFVRKFMGKATTPQQKAMLKTLGFEDDECTNLNSFIGKLFTQFILRGDIRAAELLVTLGGLTGDEIRKDAEEVRKNLESKARIAALEANMGKDLTVQSEDEGDGSVVIYLPEVEKEPDETGGEQ